MSRAVRVSRGGRTVRLDILALRKSAAEGTLSAEDRAIAENLLPGIIEPLAQKLLDLGKTGDITEAAQLIRESRDRRATG